MTGERPVGINLRAFSRSGSRAERTARPHVPERLRDRGLLVVVAAADRDIGEDGRERFGLGAWRLCEGPIVMTEGLVIPDGLSLERLTRWAHEHPVATDLGPAPRRLDELSVWMSGPFEDERRLDFRGMAYQGQASVVTVDVARLVSLLSVHNRPARGRWAGGTTYGLAGFGHVGPTGWRAIPHHPTVRLAPLGNFAHRVQFDPCPPCRGQRGGVWARMPGWRGWHPYPGRFVDVIPAACALDGVDTDELGEHLVSFGREPRCLPAAVHVDADGAEQLTALVAELHAFALVLDAEAARWL